MPDLTPGEWQSITPPELDLSGTYGTAFVTLDPMDPVRIYASADTQGLWKSTDAGATWARLGDPAQTGDTATGYLDSPIAVSVDPCNRDHLYATQGVRGTTLGFWESEDGGETWTMPAGVVAISQTIGTRDVTSLSVDPADFDHVLIGSHSPWAGLGNAGILETKDGGETFVAHPPVASWNAGSAGVHFLFRPDLGIGDASTWLVATDGDGVWRTTDAGASWEQVNPWGCPHGGNSIYYTGAGVLYMGGYQYPARSEDNGVTWEQITDGLPYAYYYSVQGDGTSLYTARSFADNGAQYDEPYLTSPEGDGLTWTPYGGGAQHFDNGPFTMRFDPQHRILYSANWTEGLWALAVTD